MVTINKIFKPAEVLKGEEFNDRNVMKQNFPCISNPSCPSHQKDKGRPRNPGKSKRSLLWGRSYRSISSSHLLWSPCATLAGLIRAKFEGGARVQSPEIKNVLFLIYPRTIWSPLQHNRE